MGGTTFNYPIISYTPDIFGMTEVIASTSINSPAVLKNNHNAVRVDPVQPTKFAQTSALTTWVTNDARIMGYPIISFTLWNSSVGIANGSKLEIWSV